MNDLILELRSMFGDTPDRSMSKVNLFNHLLQEKPLLLSSNAIEAKSVKSTQKIFQSNAAEIEKHFNYLYEKVESDFIDKSVCKANVWDAEELLKSIKPKELYADYNDGSYVDLVLRYINMSLSIFDHYYKSKIIAVPLTDDDPLYTKIYSKLEATKATKRTLSANVSIKDKDKYFDFVNQVRSDDFSQDMSVVYTKILSFVQSNSDFTEEEKAEASKLLVHVSTQYGCDNFDVHKFTGSSKRKEQITDFDIVYELIKKIKIQSLQFDPKIEDFKNDIHSLTDKINENLKKLSSHILANPEDPTNRREALIKIIINFSLGMVMTIKKYVEIDWLKENHYVF
ncbi:hypothetical protein A0H77_19560 [Vibrio alginolyticus]|uniref:hypothetical protein n=1 Tax=Vibrio alginolyticus TaxID=663 RepID=UPI00079671E9|nr:hypothetical protein [Vibrio alginolyticus]KXZ35096.1 hypothetical protein A0H77_19560 [Vibrio alginolyticus]